MAQNKGYMAKIGLDTSDVDKQIRSLSKELKQIDNSLKDNGESAVLNAQRYTVLQKQLAETKRKLEELEDAEAKMQEARRNGQIDASEYRNYQREIENTTRKIEQLNDELRQMDANGGVTNRVIQQREAEARDEAKLAAEQAQNLSQSLTKISDAANSAADTIANTVISTLKAAGGQIVNLTQQATALYSEYQQLVGGVETLFGDDAATVIQNADRAFKTAGISANEYMETATSFAASLVSSLDGNTKKAAKSVDLALTDMADNANKMGTSMQAIQNAYQGFAKQNYTMLDNLKLGYGGTKTEMERLLADAEKLSGVHYDISSLDDVINAIHTIQENIGITGTTALEAEHTISGATASIGAAWKNLLTAMADPQGGHDLEQRVNDFVDTAITSIDNMMPSIEASLDGMGEVVERLAPVISEKFPSLADKITPAIVTVVSTLFNIAVSETGKHSDEIIDTVTGMLDKLWKNTDGSAKAIIAVITGSWATLKGLGIASSVASLITSIGGAGGLNAGVSTLSTALTTELAPGLATVSTSVIALTGYMAAFTAAVIAAQAAAKWIDEKGDELVEQSKYWNGFTDVSNDAMARYAQLTRMNAEEAAKAAEEWVEADKKMLEERRANLRGLQKALEEMEKAGYEAGSVGWQSKKDEIDRAALEVQAMENVVHEEEKVLNAEKEAEEKAAEDAAARWTKYTDQQSELARISRENAEKTSADMVKQITEGRDKELAAEEEKWDAKYKWDKKNSEEYWAERKAYLETHKNNTEAWWSAWREAEKHEQDKLEEEQKKREQEQKEREKAAEDAEKKRISDLKDSIDDAFKELEIQQTSEGRDKGWLLKQQRTYIDTLDKSGDLYREYDKKWRKDWADWTAKQAEDEKKRIDAAEKEAQKNTDTWEKYAEKQIDAQKKAVEKIQQAEKKTADTYSKRIQDFTEVTDTQGNKRLIIGDVREKIKELETYEKNLEKLKSKELPEGMLDDIMSMSFDQRALYIKELLRMSDNQRSKYFTDYARYQKTAQRIAHSEYSDDYEAAATDAAKATADIWSQMPDNATEEGRRAAKAYIDGYTQYMRENGLDTTYMQAVDLAGRAQQTAAQTVKGDLTINVAGKQAIKIAFKDILAALKNSGAVIDV